MALITAGDICSKAAQMMGAYDAMTPLSAADGSLLLDLLNSLLDEWSNYTLACFEVLEQTGLLIPGQGSYTIGPGGDFNMTRPLKILTDPGTAYVMDDNGNRYYMSVVPRDRWNLFGNVSSTITSDFPQALFYDPQFPLGIINVTPFPTNGYTMAWDSMLQLSEFSTLATLVNLPPGYNIALFSNLAVLAKPFFLDGQMDPAIPATASRTLGAIKRTNQRELVAIYDSEIVSKSNVGYNVYTDAVGNSIPGVG